MDNQIEQFIRACHPCQLVGTSSKAEPIRSATLSEGPWADMAVDLQEIAIPGGQPSSRGSKQLLPVAWSYLVEETDASHVTTAMEVMFQTHGLPSTVRSDNGPPFSCTRFEVFLEYLRITHKKGTPHWPKSNGEVERCNKTLLKEIRITNLEVKDWKKAVQDFLFHYRTTPRTVTGLSPAALLMGRRLNEKLPKVTISTDRISEADCQQLLRERDARAKVRQKEYADAKRSEECSDIVDGDEILLDKGRENKLSPNFEPAPYKVIQKKCNAVNIEDQEGKAKMRNSIWKKLVQPDLYINTPEEQESGSKPKDAAKEIEPAPPTVTAQDPTLPSGATETPSHRPIRDRQPPSWMKDLVCSVFWYVSNFISS